MHNTSKASFSCIPNTWKVETPPGVSFGLPVENVIFPSSYDSLTDVTVSNLTAEGHSFGGHDNGSVSARRPPGEKGIKV